MAAVMTMESSRRLPGLLESARGMDMAIKQEIEDHETIHSGHFMLSRVHDPSPEDDDEDSSSQNTEKTVAYDFTNSKKEPSSSYEFRPSQAIDSSLSKLFECLTLAYSGKLVSPKWKAFRGLHMTIKDKVRLNNIIWREWHMQYIYGRKGVICQFASPLSDDIHTRPEAIVLEGKYWKRRLDTVTSEYKRWRKYFKSKIARTKPDPSMSEVMSHAELLDRLKDMHSIPRRYQQTSATDLLINSEFMDIDFTQDLFSSMNQPFAFPTAKEFSGFGVSDLTQPGLLSLQPTLEDFPMDTFDIQEMIQFSQNQSTNMSNIIQFTGEQENARLPVQTDIEMKSELGQGQSNIQGQNNNGTFNLVNLLLAGDVNNIQNQVQNCNTQTIINQLLQQQGQQFLQDQNSQSAMIIDNNSLTSRLTGGNQAKDATLSSLHAALTGTTTSSNKKAKDNKTGGANSTKAGGTGAKRQAKKDGFAVPVGKPAGARGKTRTIAPAPTVQKTSYSALEELLKTGTYPGAVISVKNNGGKATATIVTTPSTVVPIKPALSNCSSSATSLLTSSEKINTCTTKVKTDTTLLTHKLSTKDESDMSIYSALTKPPLQVNITAEQSLSPVSSIGSPLTNPDNPLDTSHGSPNSRDREALHRSSEQKRRFNIKHGFDTLHVLIPAIMQNSNAKISKAAMLQKTAEYCKKLKQERSQMQNEAEILRSEIETLNQAIGQCQSQLPATGVPVTRQRADQLKKMFEEYVKTRTLQNWKFWIFSKIIAHLFDTFNAMVSTSSREELCRTTLSWLDQHCSLVNLRPDVTNALTSLSTTTSILSDPSKLPEQATNAALNPKTEQR